MCTFLEFLSSGSFFWCWRLEQFALDVRALRSKELDIEENAYFGL